MDTARDCYHAMRELVLRHPGGMSDAAALATLRRYCAAAAGQAADHECAEALAAAEAHAAELFSGCGSGAWVRHQILRQLERWRARVAALSAAREAAKPSNGDRPHFSHLDGYSEISTRLRSGSRT